MPPRSLRRLLPVLAIAGTLLLPGTSRALPLSGPDSPGWDAQTLLTWLGQTFAGLWAEDSAEGGSTFTPDPLDGGPEGDTGKLIDPDG